MDLEGMGGYQERTRTTAVQNAGVLGGARGLIQSDQPTDTNSHIARHVQRLAAATEGLDREVSMLDTRLSPLTVPAPSSGSAQPMPPTPGSQLAVALSDLASRFEAQIARLRSLRESLNL